MLLDCWTSSETKNKPFGDRMLLQLLIRFEIGEGGCIVQFQVPAESRY